MLPATLPADKSVLVVAPDDPGVNQVKSLIANLNRDEKWIRPEYRSDIPVSMVTHKVGFVLLLGGVSMTTLKAVKDAANGMNIPCSQMSFTVGEAKRALEILSERRVKSAAPAEDRVNGNGTNGHHVHEGADPASEPAAVSAASAQAPLTEDQQFDESLSALDDMMRVLNHSGDHLIRIIDRCKASEKRNRELEAMMRQKDESHSIIERRNRELVADLAKYKNFYDKFMALQREAP